MKLRYVQLFEGLKEKSADQWDATILFRHLPC